MADLILDDTSLDTTALEEQQKEHAIALADAQLLGFYHCARGYSIESLIEGMGLSPEEWERMKNGEAPTVAWLPDELIEEIDNLMEEESDN